MSDDKIADSLASNTDAQGVDSHAHPSHRMLAIVPSLVHMRDSSQRLHADELLLDVVGEPALLDGLIDRLAEDFDPLQVGLAQLGVGSEARVANSGRVADRLGARGAIRTLVVSMWIDCCWLTFAQPEKSSTRLHMSTASVEQSTRAARKDSPKRLAARHLSPFFHKH